MLTGSVKPTGFTCSGGQVFHAANGLEVHFSGYISNRVDLEKTLRIEASENSAQVVGEAYSKYGASFVNYVFGEFTTAIFDHSNRVLTLAPDILGISPLYYSQGSKSFHFGTLASAVAKGGSCSDIDDAFVANFLAARDEASSRSVFNGVSRVSQGFLARFDGRQVEEIQARDFSESPSKSSLGPMDYLEGLREKITEAISGCLNSAGKTWCELSGGLDSSTVASVASLNSQSELETISLVFEASARANESDWIDVFLEEYPLRNHRVNGDEFPLFTALPCSGSEDLSARSINEALLGARDRLLAENNVDTLLTGMCGDSVFYGDSPEPFHLGDIANPWQLIREASEWARASQDGRPLSYWLMKYAIKPRFLSDLSQQQQNPPPWIHPNIRSIWNPAKQTRNWTGSRARDYYWNRVLRGARQLSLGQTPSSSGPSYRNPLLHFPLVEFMSNVPWSEANRPAQERNLQREALKGILPEKIRRRQGKRVPSQALFAGLGTSSEWLTLLTERPEIVERGFVDRDGWLDAVQLASVGHCQHVPSFLRACMLEAWLSLRST